MLNRQKIDRDPFYSGLIHMSDEELKISGYYEDSIDAFIDYAERFNLIDFNGFKCKKRTKNVILLTTGSFNPIHLGHINMVKAVEEYLSERDYNVMGAIFSSSHDKYVEHKKGEYSLKGTIRNKLIIDLLKSENLDHYTVSPWESMHLKGDVNFTEVIEHVKRHVKKHYNTDSIEICYVFGSDNMYFVNPFMYKGMCACVIRPNAPENADLAALTQKVKSYTNNSNIHFVTSEMTIDLSSTDLISSTDFSALKKELTNKTIHLLTSPLYERASKIFEQYNITIFEEITPKVLKTKHNEIPTISIDKHTICDVNIEFSRIFGPYGYKLNGYNTSQLADYFTLNKFNRFVVYDDDTYTGGTRKKIEEIANSSGISIEFKTVRKLSDIQINDVADITDFLIGTRDGLVIGTERIPYLFPLISTYARTSIVDEHMFSLEMWSLNKYLYGHMKVKDLNFSNTLYSMGFQPESSVSDVCEMFIGYVNYCR